MGLQVGVSCLNSIEACWSHGLYNCLHPKVVEQVAWSELHKHIQWLWNSFKQIYNSTYTDTQNYWQLHLVHEKTMTVFSSLGIPPLTNISAAEKREWRIWKGEWFNTSNDFWDDVQISSWLS